MADVSIVIPYASYHAGLLERAVQSCYDQTVAVDVVAVPDTELRGAGAARNRGLLDVETPYVTFLDADDWLEPDFVERCLKVIKPGKYIYTDWLEDTTTRIAPNCPWTNREWHVITTLLWTADVRAVGGFDETLTSAEDTDLFLKLTTSGVCGLHLPAPLFHYGPEGQRAASAQGTPELERIMQSFTEKYGSKTVACCGGNNTVFDNNPEGQPGDVLAYALWGGNRKMRGTVTGRLYPRSGNGAVMMVDPADGAAQPHLWKRVGAEDAPSPLTTLDGLANALRPGLRAAPPAQPAKATTPAPDFDKLAGLWQKANG